MVSQIKSETTSQIQLENLIQIQLEAVSQIKTDMVILIKLKTTARAELTMQIMALVLDTWCNNVLALGAAA